MNPKKEQKVIETRAFFDMLCVPYKELNNGHFQVLEGSKVIMQYWATTEKLHIAATNEWWKGFKELEMRCIKFVNTQQKARKAKNPFKAKRYRVDRYANLLDVKRLDENYIDRVEMYAAIQEAIHKIPWECMRGHGAQITLSQLDDIEKGIRKYKVVVDYVEENKDE